MIQAIYPQGRLDPRSPRRPIMRRKTWSREEAIRELVRGRLQGLGPVTARDLAESLALGATDIDVALLELESEGFVLRGQFTPERHDARMV